jgi:uncharacterized protein (TIGR02444 family)
VADGAKAGDAALWRFSLALYARPRVAAALLALQDHAGRDVNLMLYALWLGAVRGCRLEPAALHAAEEAIAASAEAIAALRGLRRRLRAAEDPRSQGLRRRLLALELAGERSVQARLATGVASPPDAAPAGDALAQATANFDLYLGADRNRPEAAIVRAALAGLMRRTTAGPPARDPR